jgi:hypothetical protein
MHDGRAANLGAVFDIYRRIDHDAEPSLRNVRGPDPVEANDITAFLRAASDGDYDRSVPEAVPSGLAVGGDKRKTVP